MLRCAYFLLFLSGAAGLGHQIIWTRRLVDVLGASAGTFSKVVGAFCIGLALGGAWSALKPAPVATAWRRVALAELVVALLGLVALSAIPIAEAVRALPISSHWIKRILPVALIMPPAAAMGLVLPAVLAAIQVSGKAVWAYSINTLGGVLGICGVVFLALPSWGLHNTGLAVCTINISLAALACLLPTQRRGSTHTEIFESVGAFFQARPLANLLAFTSGFLVLGLEVVAQQQFAQVTINSYFSSSTVLAIVILALGLASLVVGRVAWGGALVAALGLAAGVWLVQPVVFLSLRPGLAIIPYELPPGPYFAEVVMLSLGTLAPGFFAAGLLFPLLLRGVDRPSDVARLLALNGLGCWLGSELTQSFVLPVFGLWRSVLAAAALYLALFFWLRLRQQPAGSGRVPQLLQWPVAAGLAVLLAGY
jgi:hypothetical protein